MAFNRDSTLDIALGTGSWTGGVSDGTTLWFVNFTGNQAVAYVAATRARDSAKDIALLAGDFAGGLSDGTTLWFVDFTLNQARAYVAATRARDSAKDIALGTGSWQGGLFDGTTLWFVDDTSNQAAAYVAATRARDSAKDIAFGTGSWTGGVSDGTTLWFTDSATDTLSAYLASDQSRQAADDITHADLAGSLLGGVYANGIAWIVEPDDNIAIAFRQDLPDAEAPAVAIDAVANHNEGGTVTLGATLTGGTYDTVDYLWSIDSGGGSIDDPTAETPVYTDPDVSFNTSVTLRLTITANGTGTNAADGTSATASDTEQFAVFFVADIIPDAAAPTVAINAIGTVDESTTQPLTATLTGGSYDALAYLWEVVSGGGAISNATSASASYNAPAVTSDESVQVRLTVTASGTGTNAIDGTSDTGIDFENLIVEDIPTHPTSWRLFVADRTGNQIFELNPDALESSTAALRDLPSGFTNPRGMTVFNGRLLVVDTATRELHEIDPDGADTEGTLLRVMPTGLTSPQGMTVFEGRLLIADTTGDELWEIDPDGADGEGLAIRNLPSGVTSPTGMTVFNGRLFIADSDGDELWEIDPDGADGEGTELRSLPSGLDSPQGMTVFEGRLLIADSSGDELWEIDPDGADGEGTELGDLPTTLMFPSAMAAFNFPAVAPSVTITTANPFTYPLNLGTYNFDSQVDLPNRQLIPAALSEGRAVAYLSRLRLSDFRGLGGEGVIDFYTEAEDGTSGADLISAWETYAEAIVLSNAAAGDITIAGPSAPRLSTNRCRLNPTVGRRSNWQALDTWISNVSGAITLTLDAGTADVDENQTLAISAEISGGKYDALAYAWSDDGAGGSFSVLEAATVYTAPSVSSHGDPHHYRHCHSYRHWHQRCRRDKRHSHRRASVNCQERCAGSRRKCRRCFLGIRSTPANRNT